MLKSRIGSNLLEVHQWEEHIASKEEDQADNCQVESRRDTIFIRLSNKDDDADTLTERNENREAGHDQSMLLELYFADDGHDAQDGHCDHDWERNPECWDGNAGWFVPVQFVIRLADLVDELASSAPLVDLPAERTP